MSESKEDESPAEPGPKPAKKSADAPRGLPAFQKSREARSTRRWPSPKVAGWFLLILVVGTVIYWYRDSANVERDRVALMADQRAVDSTLGKSWFPLRDTVEKLTMDAVKDPTADLVERDELATFGFQKKPGIYLRLRVDQAASVDSIRKAAETSLHDGFTSCLMETAGDDALAGPECRTAQDCSEGQLCNELDHCANPTQPFNLRMAYRTMRVLTPEWVKDVQDASDDMRVHALRVAFDEAIKGEIPLAIKLVTQAQFYLLVMDERPAPASNANVPDGGVSPEDQEVVDGKHYPSRVYVYRLSDQKLLLRLRRDEAGQVLGAVPSSDPRAEAARLRQIRACALAMDVRTLAGRPTEQKK
jgi:hypothetical protein